MGILELLENVGENNLTVQFINTSFLSAKDKKRTRDTEITFATAETNSTELYNGAGKVGLVARVDRDWETAP